MNDYEKYVTEVNGIFSILEKIKDSWKNNDNLSSIEEIYEHKSTVINAANYLQQQSKSNDKEKRQ